MSADTITIKMITNKII